MSIDSLVISDKDDECAAKLLQQGEVVPPNYCPASSDYLLCWPPTPMSTLAVQSCFKELHGILYDTTKNATRYCNENSQWSKTNYSACEELEMDSSQAVFVITSIYYTGYSLSLLALTIAVFIFMYYRELRCLRNTIHTNLMCTYILVGLMWISTLTMQVAYQGHITICVISIILVHYATLTNFFWMFVEGLYLYMLVVKTFSVETIKLRVYLLIGWGAPVPIITVWSLARAFTTVEVEHTYQVMANHCPWMVPDVADWIYKFPTICILATNSVFLFKIMLVLITKLRSANTAETIQYRKASKALLVLIPLLGISYVLTIALPTEGTPATYLLYTRDVLLSLQGFIVAVFYCFLNTEVQNTIRHRIDLWSETRNIDLSRRRLTNSKDSPYTATESIRLFHFHDRKHKRNSAAKYSARGSSTSAGTTAVVTNAVELEISV